MKERHICNHAYPSVTSFKHCMIAMLQLCMREISQLSGTGPAGQLREVHSAASMFAQISKHLFLPACDRTHLARLKALPAL